MCMNSYGLYGCILYFSFKGIYTDVCKYIKIYYDLFDSKKFIDSLKAFRRIYFDF